MSEKRSRFIKALDALEDQLDKGFFLSFINKIIVDEKRIYTIINELRSMAPDHFEGEPAPHRAREEKSPGADYHDARFGAAAPPPAAPAGDAAEEAARAREEAENIRRGADEYARKVLQELEESITKALRVISEGKKILDDRL